MIVDICMIKQYYDDGLWNENQIRALVDISRISADDFKTITGKNY